MLPFNLISILVVFAALIYVYLTVKKYSGSFKESTILVLFLIGLFSGAFSFFGEIFLFAGITTILGGAFLGEGLKTVVLNMKRYRNKSETTLYGFSLGTGFGSAIGTLMLGIYATRGLADGTTFAWLLLFIASMLLFHSALGGLIGYGCSIEKTIRYFLYAIILHAVLSLLMPASTVVPSEVLGIVIFAFSAALFYYAYTKILPNALPVEAARKIRRTVRKERR
jgi:hypothetical protein